MLLATDASVGPADTLAKEGLDVEVVDLTKADPLDEAFAARVKAMKTLQSELTELETKQAVLDGRLQRVKSTLVQTSCTPPRR